MRRIVLATVLATAPLPARASLPPITRNAPVLEGLLWKGKPITFRQEHVLVHHREGDSMVIVTDRNIRWLRSNGAIDSIPHAEEPLCTRILENGRGVVMGTPTHVAWYEFFDNEVVVHYHRLPRRIEKCRIETDRDKAGNDYEKAEFRAERDGKTITLWMANLGF